MHKLGFTCGTFDLLHAGHILMLEEARSKCSCLIVGLQSDPTIDRKYKNKPIQTVKERTIQLEGCKYVDVVVLYSTEEELLQLLHTLPIDIRILGEEYKQIDFTGKGLPIPIYFNSRKHSYSSSELIQRVRNGS